MKKSPLQGISDGIFLIGLLFIGFAGIVVLSIWGMLIFAGEALISLFVGILLVSIGMFIREIIGGKVRLNTVKRTWTYF